MKNADINLKWWSVLTRSSYDSLFSSGKLILSFCLLWNFCFLFLFYASWWAVSFDTVSQWCDWKLTNEMRLDQVFSSTRWRRCLECDVFSKIVSKRYFDTRWIRFCTKLTLYDRKVTVFLMVMSFYTFISSSELNFGVNSIIMLYQEFSKVIHR